MPPCQGPTALARSEDIFKPAPGTSPKKPAAVKGKRQAKPSNCKPASPPPASSSLEPEPRATKKTPCQVFVFGLGPTKHPLEVAKNEEVFRSTPVKKLKELVADKLNIRGLEDIRLVYEGKQLESSSTLNDYGIQPMSNIYLTVRVSGG